MIYTALAVIFAALTIWASLLYKFGNRWIDLHKPIHLDPNKQLLDRVTELETKVGKLDLLVGMSNGFRQ